MRFFLARSERRYAKQAAEQLMAIFQRQRVEHPNVSAQALYESVVAERLGPHANRAKQVIRRALESFTNWPVERELKFRHVAHYLIFDEYMRVGKARGGTETNMGAVIASIIPDDF